MATRNFPKEKSNKIFISSQILMIKKCYLLYRPYSFFFLGGTEEKRKTNKVNNL